MSYINRRNYPHKASKKVGVLLCNLGSPDAPEPRALRRYLSEFLSDPRVVELPRLLWMVILHMVILRIRPRRSAKSYKKVWTDKGSPLAIYTKSQADKLQQRLQQRFGSNVSVDWAMRYGTKSIAESLQTLCDDNIQKLIVLPLYPQYSASTSGSTFDAIAKDFTKRRFLPSLRFVASYHDHPVYIEALALSIERYWQAHGRADKLIFSYHGIPLRYLRNGDPYHCQCLKTSRLLAERLNLEDSEHFSAFQSRFGREPWLQPYTDKSLIEFAEQGIGSIQVVCPGFSSDCLETLEEIAMENRGYFLGNGGKEFAYIPALNDSEEHIDAIEQIINEEAGSWLNDDNHDSEDDLSKRDSRYNELCKHSIYQA
ncbi:MAG: ferrochelatase [Flavobacteriales bacterium]|jgi:ferrochelatase